MLPDPSDSVASRPAAWNPHTPARQSAWSSSRDRDEIVRRDRSSFEGPAPATGWTASRRRANTPSTKTWPSARPDRLAHPPLMGSGHDQDQIGLIDVRAVDHTASMARQIDSDLLHHLDARGRHR